MMLYQIAELVKLHPGWSAVLVLSCIQIAPIKFNPWTALAQWFGRIMLGDVRQELKQIRADMETQKAEEAERNARSARRSILRAADEIYSGERHSKEYFEEILAYCDEYDRYCQEHPNFRNGKTHAAEKRIREVYERCLETHDFL